MAFDDQQSSSSESIPNEALEDFEVDDGEAGQNDLTQATIEFLNEHNQARILQLQPGCDQLDLESYIEYLGLDMGFEPELVWVAREMLCAPMPPNAEMLMSNSGFIYFHDLENDYYTFEHPLTQRYLKVLENERLDLLCLRSKPSVYNLMTHQPTALFFKKFPNMQVTCEICQVNVATRRCQQCMQFSCAACWDATHVNAEGPKKKHTYTVTPAGAFCSVDSNKKPQVYSANDQEYYTFKNYEKLHSKGNRKNHTATLVPCSDGETVGALKCEECQDAPGAFHCDQCMDTFCTKCFWKTHLNGSRRTHTVTKPMCMPMCNQCHKVRASVYDLQSHELHCTDCFTLLHWKGNRAYHLFTSADNLLLLLEKMDPVMQAHFHRARPRVLAAITSLQGYTRGIEARKAYRKDKDQVMKIQRRWRGAMTRKKLMHLMDHVKWRKKQVTEFFLPKTRQDRQQVKQRFAAQFYTKDTTLHAATQSLKKLRETVLQTADANPLEDVSATKASMMRDTTAHPITAKLDRSARMGTEVIGQSCGDAFARTQVHQRTQEATLKFAEMAQQQGFDPSANLTQNAARQDVRKLNVKNILNIDDRHAQEQ